jgi:hypothetical protein
MEKNKIIIHCIHANNALKLSLLDSIHKIKKTRYIILHFELVNNRDFGPFVFHSLFSVMLRYSNGSIG